MSNPYQPEREPSCRLSYDSLRDERDHYRSKFRAYKKGYRTLESRLATQRRENNELRQMLAIQKEAAYE